MPFNSFNFWLIFPFIFGFYWLIPSRYSIFKKWYLIIVSYLLYMNWKPVFAIVLFFVTVVTFEGGKIIVHAKNRRKTLIGIFGCLTLFPLLLFKYYNFINESVTAGLEYSGIHFALPGLNWAVPVGISFFTFQAIGYLFDVYYRRIEEEKSFTDYVLFVSFFPQIASGPISKASELLPQIKSPHPFNYQQGVGGLKLLLWGMFLKVVIADRMGMYVDSIYPNYIHYSGKICLLGSIFYSLQIYADFAGYSFMAMGIAKTLGYNLVNNFQRPYFSVSVTDFWRRWHISLSRWLKDYVYIPMGGSRCSRLRNYWNILVTFLISGIWHGANWTFIVWGLFHGIAQIIEKALHLQKYEGRNVAMKACRILVTFLIVNCAWIFFRMPSLQEAYGLISRIFTNFGDPCSLADYKLSVLLIIPLLKDVKDEFLSQRISVLNHSAVRMSAYVFLFTCILLLGILSSGQFIYVNF